MLKNFYHEKYDILIQAGQSNSEGYGFGCVDEPYLPNDSVWYMNGDFTITRAVETVFGNEIQGNFALSFANEYVNRGLLKDGRKLLILRCAVAGTGFLDNRWKQTDDLYIRMMEMIRTALSLNAENRLVAILWHQGETDANLKATESQHYDHLKKLLMSIREEFESPELPFIAGDFVYQWKNQNLQNCVPILNAIHAVCDDCGYSDIVETDGLYSNLQELQRDTLGGNDIIHFSRKSLYILGERYFDAYYKMINK